MRRVDSVQLHVDGVELGSGHALMGESPDAVLAALDAQGVDDSLHALLVTDEQVALLRAHLVREAAAVERIDVAVRRAMLPDEPWHPRAAAPYWILRLGAPMALPEPLVSQRLRRFSFRYTQWWWLLCAGDVANSGSAAPAVPAAAPWW